MTRLGLLGKAAQVLTAMSVALSIGVAGPATPVSAGSYPDFAVTFYAGASKLATVQEKFQFSVHVKDVAHLNIERSPAMLYINVPRAFTGVRVVGATSFACELLTKVTPTSDSVVRCMSESIGIDPYGDSVMLEAVAPPTTGRFSISASVSTGRRGFPDINADNNSADLLVVVGSGSVPAVKTQPQRAR